MTTGTGARLRHLGLDEPVPYGPSDRFRRIFGETPYIEEGRKTFEALVPNRYKAKDRADVED